MVAPVARAVPSVVLQVISFDEITPEDVDAFQSYHKGRASRPDRVPYQQRRFVAWDGEGMNLRGPKRPQSYVLFGNSTGESIEGPGLHTFDILDFIVEQGAANPDAIHVGFAFTYDVNMIVQSLHSKNLRYLHERGYLNLSRNNHRYCIQFRRGKWFSVTRYKPNYHPRTNPQARDTVRIYDIFSFFVCSFVKAATAMLGADAQGMDVVREGKAARNDFMYDELDYVKRYWTAEIEMVRLVAEELRVRLYGAGLLIREWHGPGALASYSMRQHGIKKHMNVTQEEVRKAARYGYAGGRFELYKVGRVTGPIYGIDINSAYPYGISQLPSLTDGSWHYVSGDELRSRQERGLRMVARFAIYHCRVRHSVGFDKRPGPLFHRDDKHLISYPWITEGWYWSPEIARLVGYDKAEIVEGWEYLGSTQRPFEWVQETYEQRKDWKAQGNTSEYALKLMMNSLYGKMAQRVGWDPVRNRIPPWHQLEWAGWVTSYCRSMLYGVMARIPWRDLIAVETDGIYTTYNPDLLGITPSKELGGWSIDTYDELMYVQSGLAWMRSGDVWTPKRRGLDADTFTREQCEEYIRSLRANERWAPYVGKQTRFITLGAAINAAREDGGKLKGRHCVWETTDRAISPGEHGKRIHVPHMCRACKRGTDAYTEPHDLVIRSKAAVGDWSAPHSIPWEGEDVVPSWRSYEDSQGEGIRD